MIKKLWINQNSCTVKPNFLNFLFLLCLQVFLCRHFVAVGSFSWGQTKSIRFFNNAYIRKNSNGTSQIFSLLLLVFGIHRGSNTTHESHALRQVTETGFPLEKDRWFTGWKATETALAILCLQPPSPKEKYWIVSPILSFRRGWLWHRLGTNL